MTTNLSLPDIFTGSPFEPMFRLWMMPAQLGFELMESGMAMMANGLAQTPIAPKPVSPAKSAASKTDAAKQTIARAAEEQAAHIDDGTDAVVLAAALIA